MKIFAIRLKELRMQQNLTQRELADILGYSCSAISNYEIGKNEPSFMDLIRIANYFCVSLDYLLGRTEFRGGFHFKETLEIRMELKVISIILDEIKDKLP